MTILTLLVRFLLVGSASAAPAGIYLYAMEGKQAAPDKVICLEFERLMKDGIATRFFHADGNSYKITDYKLRDVVYFEDTLGPENPDFPKRLAIYQKAAADYPAARKYLTPRIERMQTLANAVADQKETRGRMAKLVIGRRELLNPRFKGFGSGVMFISHADGSEKVNLDEITDDMLASLKRIDPTAASIRIVIIGGKRLWNPRNARLSAGIIAIDHEAGTLELDLDLATADDLEKARLLSPEVGKIKSEQIGGKKFWNPSFGGVSGGKVTVSHEKGKTTLEISSLSFQDKAVISGWSDGSWSLSEPGFYQPSDSGASYGELVLSGGKLLKEASLTGREGEQVTVMSKSGSDGIQVRELVSLPGITTADKRRLEGWIDEMIEERVQKAAPIQTVDVLSFNKSPGPIQVAGFSIESLEADGVFARNLTGTRLLGRETVRTTTSVVVDHPVDKNRKIHRVTGSSVSDRDVNVPVREDLCFIGPRYKNARVGRIDGKSAYRNASLKLRGTRAYSPDFSPSKEVNKYLAE